MKKTLQIFLGLLICSNFAYSIDAPINISPSNGAIDQAVSVTIDWSSVTGNTGYIYQLDTTPLFNSVLLREVTMPVNSSQATVSDLYFGTKYYWRVETKSGVDLSVWSATWNFTTTSYIYNVSPSNGAIDQAVALTLDWSSMTGNTGYIYQLDTSANFNSPLLINGTTAINSSEVYVSNLYFGTKYYWRAAAKDAVDTSAWTVTWNYTTATYIYNVSPSNGAIDQAVALTIDWSSMTGNTGYIYQLDTSANFNSPLLINGTTAINSSEAYVSNLYFGTKYYWRAAAKNAVDTSAWTVTWNYTTATYIYNVSPSNGAIDQAVALTIDWSGMTGNTGFIYQLDTSANFNSPLLINGTTAINSSEAYVSNLYFGTKYYWRAAAKNAVDTSAWTVTWNYTTATNIYNVSPSNGAIDQAVALTIDWSGMTGNTGYIYQLDTAASFNSPLLINGTTAINSSEAYVSNLYFGTKYYWRAAAKNAVDTSAWTVTWNYTTAYTITNVAPTNAATGQAVAVTLDWSSMTGNTGYIYQLDTTTSFNSSLFVSGTTIVNSSEILVSNLYFGTKYYWRAAAKNAVDTSAWTGTWNLTTASSITNVTPVNGAINQAVSLTLDWNSMTGNTGYICEVDTAVNFNSALKQSVTTIINSSQATVSGLLYGTTYYWHAAVKDAVDTSNYSSSWRFTTAYQLTVAPVLASPSNNSTNISYASVGLVWNASTGATAYQYQYSTDATFETGVHSYNTSLVTGTITGLYPHTVYYWRVRGSNATGNSPWSTVWNFTTESAVLVAPELISPANNSTDIDFTSVTLDWNSVFGASQYIYQFSPDENFIIGVTSETIVPTQKTLLGLAANTQYFWRVKASDGAVESDWSITWNFTTANDGLAAPILLSPANNSTEIDYSSMILQWNSVFSATQFTWQLSTDNLFITDVQNGTLPALSIEVVSLLPNTQYFWRVLASSGIIESDWSEVWSFTTMLDVSVQNTFENTYSVYPNPSNGLINIELFDSGAAFWKISNLTGQIINEGNTNDQIFQLNMESYAPGVYMLNIQQNDSNVVKRIVRK